MMDGSDDEEDAVVQEVDVYLSHTLAPSMHLLQYPLRPTWRPYDKNELTEVRYKEKVGKLELDFTLDPDCETYDLGGDPSKKAQYTLSSCSVPPKTNYAVGILRDRSLHLTPLKGVYQLRPSFQHIDEVEKEKKDREGPAEEAKAEKQKKTTRKAVEVEFKRPETARSKYYKEKSFAFLQQTEEQEPWLSLAYSDRSKNPVATRTTFESLLSASYTPIIFDAPHRRYLDTIVPQMVDEQDRIMQRGSKVGLSLDQLAKLPVGDRVRTIMHTVQIISFADLCTVMQCPDDEVLDALQTCAILVGGRWVAKSELCVTARLQMARNYLLLLFHTGVIVRRRAFAEATGVTLAMALKLLKPLAEVCNDDLAPTRDPAGVGRFETPKGSMESSIEGRGDGDPFWRLTLPKDEAFAKAYPSVVEEQEATWEERGMEVKQSAWMGRRANGEPSKTALVRASLQELLEARGVCSHDYIAEHIAEAGLPTVADAELDSVLFSLCGKRNSSYYLKSVGDEEQNKYRRIILQLFEGSMVVKKSAALKEIEAVLGVKMTTEHFYRVIQEFATAKKGTRMETWVFKTGE